jgi:NhaA family Na+:H+ antiporter
VLIGATAAALAAATIFGQHAVHAVWEHPIALYLGADREVRLALHGWINEGLMTLFFLLVGLEIKREMLVGELSSPRDALLPAAGAMGGVIVPALIYTAFNAATAATHGWAIPTATDIAFVVGIMVLLGERVPRGAVVFMTALAIADDLFAVIAIALFYTGALQYAYLAAAGMLFLLLVLFNRAGIRDPFPYAMVGVFLWYAMLRSGVHSTVSGLLLALAIPARSRFSPAQFEARIDELRGALPAADPAAPRDDRMAAVAEAMERAAIAVQSPLQRIEHRLTPWVTFLVVPLFALANAGIDLRAVDLGGALADPVTLGVALGLPLGKFAGISAFAWLAVRFGVARLPAGVAWRHVCGCAWLGGIGFTMSLFIGALAFAAEADIEHAKLGTLLGSAVAAFIGIAWLLAGARPRPPSP